MPSRLAISRPVSPSAWRAAPSSIRDTNTCSQSRRTGRSSGTGTRTPNSTSRVSRVADYTIPERASKRIAAPSSRSRLLSPVAIQRVVRALGRQDLLLRALPDDDAVVENDDPAGLAD